jgi:DNA-binding response OmpR family regulator
MSKTILVVDDTPSVRALVQEYLSAEGFRVLAAEDGAEALRLARQEQPDLILLDLMLPEVSGFDFLTAYRRETATPVIVLTARQDLTDKVLGLELGADDYVTKPFSPRELVARVRAVLRRASAREAPGGAPLRVGSLALDRGRHTVLRDGRPILLTPSEFELLAALMEAPGHVFSRAQLLERLQGIAFDTIERTIDVHVRNLRRKLEPDPATPRYIETVFGVGYRFQPADEPPAARARDE